MELKTLKDIKIWDERHYEIVEIKELRAEAIKWIKEFEEELQPLPEIKSIGKSPFTKPQSNTLIFMTKEINCSEGVKDKIKVALVEWIKHFFNITEDDLNGIKNS